MFAQHDRPHPSLGPCIRRRWWLFGPRQLCQTRFERQVRTFRAAVKT
jgi:hypothetical protein